MSQPVQPAPTAQAASYPQYVMVPIRESNGLGIAGFFIAFIGLFVPTGIVALLGLLVSLVALGKAPRGFASMGVLLGLFGTVLWLAILGVAVLGAVVAGVVAIVVAAAAFVLTQPEIIEVTADMVNVTLAAIEYEEEKGELPADVADLGLAESTLTDPWGSTYYYYRLVDEGGFDVVSAGGDKVVGTDDDVALSRLGAVWEEAFASFEGKMQELGRKLERLENRNIRIEGTHIYSDSRG